MKFNTNTVSRKIPTELQGRKLIPFSGKGKGPYRKRKYAPKIRKVSSSDNKVLKSLRKAIKKSELTDGGTISFHHHFRNGDFLLNMVCHEIAKMGLKDIRLVPSSIQGVHKEILPYLEKAIITSINCGTSGTIAVAISHGKMEGLLTIRSHEIFTYCTDPLNYNSNPARFSPNLCRNSMGYQMAFAKSISDGMHQLIIGQGILIGLLGDMFSK
ncbi:MAG: hypothetical protein HZR80_17480 [Candidatus Heimdallarchaeota archaeon]